MQEGGIKKRNKYDVVLHVKGSCLDKFHAVTISGSEQTGAKKHKQFSR